VVFPEKTQTTAKPAQTNTAGETVPATAGSAPATITVNLPADAKLTIDDSPTNATSGNRTFATPALEAGNEYFYTLKVEVTRNGQTVTDSKRISVRGGEETQVNFDFSDRVAAN
jgi:uncharacterized protein (TIGR03000 family)